MIEKAKKQDNCKVVFEHVSIDCLNGTAETKVFSNFPVTIEGKVFYVGNSQFTVKLKDVEKLDLEPNGLRLKDSKNQRLFDCKFVGCRDSEWKSFQRLAEKLIRKRDEKLGKATSATAITKASQKHTRKATAGRGGPRKMYGSKRYRPSSLISTNSIWSDEEDELEKEKNAPQDSGDVDDDEDEPERFVVDKPEYDEDGEQEDEEVEDPLELAATKTPQSKGDRQTRRRLKKVKAKDSKSKADSDSEDEIFQEEPKPKVSTPYLGHRVVTPHEHAVVVDDENEDEEKENMEDQEKLQSTPKGQKKLDSFFSKAQMTKSENTIDNKKAQKMVTPKSANSPLARGNNLVAVKSSSSTVRKSSQSISQMLSPTAKKQNATEINSSPSSLGDAHSRIAEHPTTSTKKKFPKKYLWSSMDDDDDAEPLNAETTTACESPSALTQREKKRPRLLESSDSKSKRFSLKQRSYFTSAATLPRTPSISDAVVVESPYRGLKNMGNTCYLNSGIQMLCSLPGFIRAIEGKGGNLAEAFYSTAKDLLNDTSKPGVALSAKTVKAAMDQKSDKFLGFEQRDAHEFLGDLIDVLHEELRKGNAEDKDADKTEANQPKDDNMETDEGEAEATSSKTASVHKVENDRTPADDYFRCNIEVCLTCLNCGYSRYVLMYTSYCHMTLLLLTSLLFVPFYFLYTFYFQQNQRGNIPTLVSRH